MIMAMDFCGTISVTLRTIETFALQRILNEHGASVPSIDYAEHALRSTSDSRRRCIGLGRRSSRLCADAGEAARHPRSGSRLVTADSGPSRSPIPGEREHAFRRKVSAHSGMVSSSRTCREAALGACNMPLLKLVGKFSACAHGGMGNAVMYSQRQP